MSSSQFHSHTENDDEQSQREVTQAGLRIEDILRHRRNVRAFLLNKTPKFFPVKDTCRLDNEGIRQLPEMAPVQDVPLIAFVPAAGASSRYLSPLSNLVQALRSQDSHSCLEALKALEENGILKCPLPPSLKDLESSCRANNSQISSELASSVLDDVDAPKALYPAVLEGQTFLELKRIEHQAIGGLAGEVYICPPGRTVDFMSTAEKIKSKIPMVCFEQGAALATVRFDGDGSIARGDDGKISTVPAGHGSLVQLISDVPQHFPKARGVFIRNIDNVTGVSQDVVKASRFFMAGFQRSLKFLDNIRNALAVKDSGSAADSARDLLELWSLPCSSNVDPIDLVLKKLFHAPVSKLNSEPWQLLMRPLVLMGQVPNTARDVGGTCVFTTIDGLDQKLCLERPHASPEDQQRFLDDPVTSTHFNPVFVAAEVPSREVVQSWSNHPFWLIAKKSWNGREVLYQESILYELLGSSQYTNLVFVEVPRKVFNPHKTLADASGKHLSDWGVN